MNEYSIKSNEQKKSHRGKVSGNSKHLLLEGELVMTQDLQEIKIIRLGADLSNLQNNKYQSDLLALSMRTQCERKTNAVQSTCKDAAR